MNQHPTRALIASSQMHLRQFIVTMICVLINTADGYDVLSLAFAAPQLTRELHISAELLGIAFSATSVGLCLGAFLVAPLADWMGRRRVVLSALVIITLAHFGLAGSQTATGIVALRLAMGTGLGTLVVSLNVMVAEFSNDRWRNVLLAIGHAGFSLGMAVSGGIAAWVLAPFGWRYIFIGGGALNVVVLLLAVAFLLESPDYLLSRQPRNALARVNDVLRKMKHAPLDTLPPPIAGDRPGINVGALLAPEIRRGTILIWVAALGYAIVGYFLMNWKPQILVNAGMSPTQASYVGIVNGVFGTMGHLSIAFLSRRIEETWLTGIYFTMLAIMLVVFAAIPPVPLLLLGTSGVLTLFTVGAYTGLFLVAIKFYDTSTRNAGVSFVVGWGRVGAIIGPLLGGALLGAGFDRSMMFAVFASIAIVPVMTMFLAARTRSRGVA